jgi:hypothetical protein
MRLIKKQGSHIFKDAKKVTSFSTGTFKTKLNPSKRMG